MGVVAVITRYRPRAAMGCLTMLLAATLLAGCTHPSTANQEATDPSGAPAGHATGTAPPQTTPVYTGLHHPVLGQWWRYEVTGPGVATEATLVYDDVSGAPAFTITDRDVGRRLAIERIPLIGHSFSNWTWSGTFFDSDAADSIARRVHFSWIADADPRDASIAAVDDDAVTFAYHGAFTGMARFPLDSSWFSWLRIDKLGMEWKLVEQGVSWTEESLTITQRTEIKVEQGGEQSIEFAPNGGNVLWVAFSADCPLAGHIDHQISPFTNPVEPIHAKTYQCPWSGVDETFQTTVVQHGKLRHQVVSVVPETWTGEVRIVMLLEFAV